MHILPANAAIGIEYWGPHNLPKFCLQYSVPTTVSTVPGMPSSFEQIELHLASIMFDYYILNTIVKPLRDDASMTCNSKRQKNYHLKLNSLLVASNFTTDKYNQFV
jgi:hypothetical protein